MRLSPRVFAGPTTTWQALPAAAVYVQHGLFRQGLGERPKGGLGDGDADHGQDVGRPRR